MGFAISWIAIKDKSPQQVLEYFGFSETSEKEDIPESAISSALLANGWYLIWFNQCESPFVQREIVAELSSDCTVVLCVVEEHVMYSRAEYWESGDQVWRIIHDAQKGMYDLQASGRLPNNYESLKSEIFDKQASEGGEKADVDLIFDLPLEFLKQLTFFKHDEETPEIQGQEYTVLISNRAGDAATKSKAWWKIW